MRCDDGVAKEEKGQQVQSQKSGKEYTSQYECRVDSILDHLHEEDRTPVFIGQGLVCWLPLNGY
jgi:hypothetical protein